MPNADLSEQQKPSNDPQSIQNFGDFTSKLSAGAKTYVALIIIAIILSFLFTIMFYVGAATLSYRHYGSVFWAIVAFFTAPVYYVFYALYLDKPQPNSPTGIQAIMGGARKLLNSRR